MGLFHSPSISTDKLKLFLDATNLKSYPGSGTVWYDLSGKNNYTMFGNVPIYSQSNFKYWDFSGNNNGDSTPRSYNSPLGFTPPGNMNTMGFNTTGSFTISSWFTHDGSGGQISLFANAGSADGFRFGPSSGGYYWLMGLNYREGVSFTNANSGDGNWHYVNAVFDRANEYSRSGGATVYIYQDGVLLGNVGDFGSQSTMQATGPGISRNPCCLRFTGKLATLSWHNKALSSSEVLINYNSLRSRFI